MIHFKPILDTKLKGRANDTYAQLVSYNYPFINTKVVKEVAATTKFSEDKISTVMSFWNKFVDDGMREGIKRKIPYVGSFYAINSCRERSEEELDDEDFNEIEFK